MSSVLLVLKGRYSRDRAPHKEAGVKRVFIGFALLCAASMSHADRPAKGWWDGYWGPSDEEQEQWSAPRGPIYWHFALAFDEDTGAWDVGRGADKQQAIVYAQKGCQKFNIKDKDSFFGGNKTCDRNYTWGGDTTNKSPPMVYVRAQTKEKKYRFVVNYGNGDEDKQAALADCTDKYNFQNCELVGVSRRP